MKTITVKGKVYEIGKLYGSAKGIGGLCGHSINGFELRKNSDKFCISAIYPVDLDAIGTIKDAPIELDIGEWYMVEIAGGTKMAMYWDGVIFTECVDANGDSCGGVAKLGGLKVISKLKAIS